VSYYSSNGVDAYIEPLLPEVGFACDVGANDGKMFSNSLCFEEKGWTVICVEPNPLLVEEGSSVRKLWRQVACGSEDGVATFYASGGHPYASDSSIDLGRGQPFEVQVLRLDRVLEEAGFRRLDYLTVDVESWEPQVMAGFTLERWRPKIIVLESWKDDLATPEGYTRLGRKEFDNIYQRIGT